MTTKKPKAEPNLKKEISALADQIGNALKAAKDSDELKELREETLGSLRAAGSRIVNAFESAKTSDSVQEIKDQARKVYDVSKDKTHKTVGNFGENLAAGLRHISKELEAIADRLHKE